VPRQLVESCETLDDLETYLRKSYTENVTAQFAHVQNEDERIWLHENYEKFLHSDEESLKVTDAQRTKALQLLLRAEQFEKFMQKRFPTHKRYSGEGSEALIVALNSLISEASKPDLEASPTD